MKQAHIIGAICAILVPLIMTSNSQATPVTYTDQAAFLAALPGTLSTQNFDSTAFGAIVDGGSVGDFEFIYGSELSANGAAITVTDGTQNGGGTVPFDTTSGSNFLGTDNSDLFASGDDFDLSFAATNAIGMFFISAEEIGVTLFDGDIELTAGGGTASLLTTAVQQILPDGVSNVFFLGIIDDMTAFTTASVSSFCQQVDPPNDTSCETLFSFNIDDIVTNSNSTGPGPSPVPEPTTLAILALGLAGLGVSRRRYTLKN